MTRIWKRIFIAALFAGPMLAEDLFPLLEGNTWTYRNAIHGGSFSVTVHQPVVFNDRVYMLTGYVDGRILVRVNEQNQLVQVDYQDSGQDTILTDFQSSNGAWWETPARGCGKQGQTLDQRVTHDGVLGPLPNAPEGGSIQHGPTEL